MRKNLNNGFEYEYEAQLVLPSALPKNEKILWQGTPHFWTLAKNLFWIRAVMVYFLVLIVMGFIEGYQEGQSNQQMLMSFALMVLMSILGTGMLAFLAFCTARTTVYTITNRRVVMRIGVVLTKTFNLPLTKIESADIVSQKNQIGNIAIQVESSTKIAFFHLWPHARPWRLQHPEPMLLGLESVDEVSTILTQAWSEANQLEVVINDVNAKNKMSDKKRASGLMPAFSNESSSDFAQI